MCVCVFEFDKLVFCFVVFDTVLYSNILSTQLFLNIECSGVYILETLLLSLV